MSEDVTTETDTYRDLLDPTSLALRHQLGILGVVMLGLLPLGVDRLMVLKLTGALYFAVFAMSWDAVSGYTGQISFGHGLFFTVGGYSSALLNLRLGVDPALAVVVGTVLAAVAGVVVGVPALRLEGPYLSLVTLVAPLILLQIFVVFSDTFGGELGLSSPEALLTFERFETVITANYYLAFGLFVFVLLLLLAVTRSDAGAVFTAIREDEEAVAAAGLNPAKFKIFAFVLSAAVGGLGGAMFVHTPSVGSPQPSQLLVLTVSIEVIIASVLGGMGTIVGPAVGGLFYYMLRDYISGVKWTVPVLNAPVSDLDLFLFSLITLALLFFLPGGIVRWVIRNGQRALHRSGRRGDRVAPDGGTEPLEGTLGAYREAFEHLTDPRRRSDDRQPTTNGPRRADETRTEETDDEH
ncbi:branched-chain amino acid ABC transporter permease [Halorussus gelatinilyticus]|uniref:Branched-chain amino acid ABC transporter permease n=1 Tax=Halorussus gelatinilyticus TaxID=2937524 RepID=A0A8U0IDR4_9EURY|nr:branched-chain amino acid ABC transporter permease [Halorussus gelatinilyticus]UPV98914.1 branched-chain amino acid ABC transporter permease [Halorussus gelatinilyticus]